MSTVAAFKSHHLDLVTRIEDSIKSIECSSGDWVFKQVGMIHESALRQTLSGMRHRIRFIDRTWDARAAFDAHNQETHDENTTGTCR